MSSQEVGTFKSPRVGVGEGGTTELMPGKQKNEKPRKSPEDSFPLRKYSQQPQQDSPVQGALKSESKITLRTVLTKKSVFIYASFQSFNLHS